MDYETHVIRTLPPFSLLHAHKLIRASTFRFTLTLPDKTESEHCSHVTLFKCTECFDICNTYNICFWFVCFFFALLQKRHWRIIGLLEIEFYGQKMFFTYPPIDTFNKLMLGVHQLMMLIDRLSKLWARQKKGNTPSVSQSKYPTKVPESNFHCLTNYIRTWRNCNFQEKWDTKCLCRCSRAYIRYIQIAVG